MAFELPPLPYAKDALAPHISAETLEFHHGKHHAGYVNKLNAAVEQDAALQGKSLEQVIDAAKGGVYNNAAQVWNHTFYWSSMSPDGGGQPGGALAKAIDAAFGGFDAFKEQFSAKAGGHFASGWAWLVKTSSGGLAIEDTHDAITLGTAKDKTPLLVCDVWEHAYYIDYRNARPEYLKAWWNVVNWSFVEKNLG